MLYLNNPLLTSEKIIAYFESNLIELNKAVLYGSKKPSALSQFKSKLKAIFFNHLDKNASDEDVLQALQIDVRFVTSYPQLKQVLHTIFALKDHDDKTAALEGLKSIQAIDWDPANADAQWTLNNQKYGYFDNASNKPQLFIELATACRTMIVLFEKNNTQDDTMAYEYAYKLMALFMDRRQLNAKSFDTLAKEAYNLVAYNDSDKAHPFHDTLLVKLNLPPANALHDKAGWQALVKSAGIKAFYFLAMAEKIEEKIAKKTNETGPRAPINLEEAKAIAVIWVRMSGTKLRKNKSYSSSHYY